MTIALFEEEAVDREQFRTAFPGVTLTIIPEPLQAANASVAVNADVVSIFVKSSLKKDVLDQLPSLKFIATRSTGFDHVDMDVCAERGITVSNVPNYGENSVAEYTFALILALARKIHHSYERTERFNFHREGLKGFDLLGKTIGVVGVGRIGRFVVKIAHGLGMHVLAYDARPKEDQAKELNYTYVKTLKELLAQSDVVTLHAPAVPGTQHMINMENIKYAKKGALLINTARGSLVDTAALVWALDEGILGGAGLDVLEEEDIVYEEIELLSKGLPRGKDIATLLRNHILIARDDVIITPHNAFNTDEALQRIIDTTLENIRGYLQGKPMNVVQTA